MNPKKTVLITGASRGIGKAMALLFAKHQHYNIVIVAKNNLSLLNNVKSQINEMGAQCLCFLTDVSQYKPTEDMIKEIYSQFNTIDIVINNAGLSYIGLLTDMNVEQWQSIIGTNLNSLFNVSHCVIPDMVRQKKGKIINISSVWGEVGACLEVAYSASKGGMNAFTKALAKELAPSNIQVNAISCGMIDTDMNHNFSLEEINHIIDEIPSGRMGSTADVAQLAYYLCQDTSNYITGQILRVDGGWL
ncbi:3-oxoacyl-[acyl-carrier protein] reductase [Natranaerovirga hydrolytica]|uniref:3-oxoacyl-[acyl-carrier protein] reductase n=1 Tax=Natranaerovirga hydrolytica TaxID=680378 RepID=A0A4R1MQ22_9FIRM|nr:3-oxoacyl-ACP reductase FabG [Natranaerovirga hydrolytica]TCK93454.1 3-oxoacyl-[acyl-carrier protein] reductase [Natranaerovirga hydrolytica]